MNNSEAEDKMMTVAEVAEFLGFKPATIYGYIRNGKIPVYRASGRWRFRYSEIQEWLTKNTRAADDMAAHQIGAKSLYSSAEEQSSEGMELRRKSCVLLQDAGILNGLNRNEIELLADVIQCEEKSYQDQDVVIFNTQKMNSFLIVESGILSIPMGAGEGIVTSKHDYRRGNILGLDVMMTTERTSYYTATAKGEVSIMTYAFDTFLSKRHLSDSLKVKLLTNISNLLADENIRRMKKIEMLQEKNLRGRILSYLLQAESKAGGSPFELSDNRSEMARHLGMNRSVFSNELNTLRRDGVIDFDKNIFTICRGRDELEDLRHSKRGASARKSLENGEVRAEEHKKCSE